jgi:hypothetical protein
MEYIFGIMATSHKIRDERSLMRRPHCRSCSCLAKSVDWLAKHNLEAHGRQPCSNRGKGARERTVTRPSQPPLQACPSIYPELLVLPTLCHVNLFLHPQALSLENFRYTAYIIVCQSIISAPKHSFKEQDRPLGAILIPYRFTCGTTPLHDPQCTPQTSSRLRASWLSASHNQPPACSPPFKAPRPAQAPT